ncbi:hypothetical protein CYMTET_2946 [Cymbomonas tetramitiformis]|uniref:Uncharacterized protein n=1 Tax=Cymbomonas tetramitiformis TaxID=36881 RepID=A0AAE0H430_9CHLO|nr:hypothetical protein CYMTET_2946 [Cymbomonas tetramitiformis]
MAAVSGRVTRNCPTKHAILMVPRGGAQRVHGDRAPSRLFGEEMSGPGSVTPHTRAPATSAERSTHVRVAAEACVADAPGEMAPSDGTPRHTQTRGAALVLVSLQGEHESCPTRHAILMVPRGGAQRVHGDRAPSRLFGEEMSAPGSVTPHTRAPATSAERSTHVRVAAEACVADAPGEMAPSDGTLRHTQTRGAALVLVSLRGEHERCSPAPFPTAP